MSSFLTKIVGDKKAWKAMEARGRAATRLPDRLRLMKAYLWRFTSGDGADVVDRLEAVLALFETSAAQGKLVLEVTGEDVAAFSDDLLQGTRSFLDQWRRSLNDDVASKLAQ